ncbi:phage shock protein operon transcriptional activator [Kordiimonas pumila]|uniref:Phage shock protein operon transcriptional activator n=1 Tax=Kordiimonas pumila TaxID=2161677 RepID=A0ABV7CZU4_9PROT|nr:phage shock protein operon transcriptional activator [Kordiimonas pumila]
MDQIIGSSPTFLDMIDQVSRAAPLDRPMLVIGERGTGKEMIAARLHFLSNRWENTYQKLNCAALTTTLLESELFGYEQGAFTGARGQRAGRFEAADQGTLFLDEIGTMSMAAQEKLLRVIEYGEFERVGGTETIQVNVRVVAATNIDLPSAADSGEFRHDLLDRLAFDVITVPPLRERPEDIPVLANHFGAAMASELEWLHFPGFTNTAMEAMENYAWPGNIRELKNVVERAIYQAWDGEEPINNIIFDPFDSPFRPAAKNSAPTNLSATVSTDQASHTEALLPTVPFDYRAEVEALERRLLDHALKTTRYNKRLAAKNMGLGYDQLRHLIKKYQLSC